MLDALPRARVLIGDGGYESRAFRDALSARGTAACIPSSRSRKIPIPHDPAIYRRRHRIESLFARIKDWRRIATRYDQCAHTFMAAITIAAIMICSINES